jgi:hypothetical protein
MSHRHAVYRKSPNNNIFVQTTNAVFLGSPPPIGYGWSQFAIAGAYGIPIVRILFAGKSMSLLHLTQGFCDHRGACGSFYQRLDHEHEYPKEQRSF